MRTIRAVNALALSVAALVSCSSAKQPRATPSPHPLATKAAVASRNLYAYAGADMLSPAATRALPRVYVPNSLSDTVDEIDQRTWKIVAHFTVGKLPQHVTPSHDFKTLYVLSNTGNRLTPIDPRTGKPGTPIPVLDPYNMYFTLDGRFAVVVAEGRHELDFRDPHTFKLLHSLHVPCAGINHMDFSADGRYAIASCEFSGALLRVDMEKQKVAGLLRLPRKGSKPQDVKISPDGTVYFVADEAANGLWEVDGVHLRTTGFLPTGRGAHGLYPSRDATLLYATNRGEGSISVMSFRTRKIISKWHIPGGGSPDMGGVSADGKLIWVSGRYDSVVYAIDARSGRLLTEITVGRGPHGLSVWPQPGRYSLGHTGVTR